MPTPPRLPPSQYSAGENLNTGPGGFGIDGQQMLFDIGLPEPANPKSPYGTYAPAINVNESYLDANGKPKDLTNVTKKTLGQYLSKLTQGKEGSATSIANAYPVDATGPTQISLLDEKGYPAQLESPPKNQNTFAGGSEATIDYPSANYTSISPYIKKGIAPGSNIDGNDLLPGVAGTSTYIANINDQQGESARFAPVTGHKQTDAKINAYQASVMSMNRFTGAAASYVASSQVSAPDSGYDPQFPVQKKLGYHDPKAATISAGRLASIGSLLTLRAANSLGANNPGADPNSGGMQAGAILPSPTQLGIATIDQSTMLAAAVLNQLTNDEPTGSDVLSIGGQSWGVLNDTDDPFSGTDALGMLALSVALVAGVELLFEALSFILGLITPSSKKPSRDSQGRYTLGEYFSGTKEGNKAAAGGIGGAISALSSLNIGALLGILPTNYPFSAALSTGTSAFFGMPASGGFNPIGAVVGALASSTDSPGFNVVIARSIVRSSITIAEQLGRIGGNPMNAINQILSLIDVIRSSKLVAACNVFATLGDAILSQPSSWQDPDQPNKFSSMDATSNDIPGAAIAKSRLQGSLKLAWASNRAPANVLLPASILGLDAALNAQKGFGQFSPYMGLGQDGLSNLQVTLTKASDSGRIDPALATKFEDSLGASYVPFYFHDIRTNEMISFHAFLASLNDDYNASYDKSEGFGRVEPVKIYKGTERRINMSFYIAATSLLDFDEMWVKINKLVTLVYPQYTKGMQLSSADGTSYKFTQPFSQLIGSSPMIRIRLGDLLRSNYSLFALGRLFGMGNSDFTVDSKQLTGAESLSQDDVDNIAAALYKAQDNPAGELYVPQHGTYELFDDSGGAAGGLSVPSPPLPSAIGGSSTGPQYAAQFRIGAAYFEIKAVQIDPNNPTNIIGEVRLRTDESFNKWVSDNGTTAALQNQFNDPDANPDTRYVGGKYIFPVEHLTAQPYTNSKIVSKLQTLSSVISSNNNFVSNVVDFLDPTKNAVAKSFADTSGKGLAGFIETMNFDWINQVTWETQDGRTAPKICKVTIGFSPIHDISPGLDHNGFNRAPTYPVGVMGQRK